jgi:xanthine dehydrogenase YagS FAD-binding subunit
MHPFLLERPRDLAAALALRAQAGRNDADAEYIAGGTDMVQLLQENVRTPHQLVSLAGLLDSRVELTPQGLRLGAAATMADVAANPTVAAQFPVISQALLNSASPQVRNQATMGGNLLQRTRCPYFRDTGYAACNKRQPGSGCSAIIGENRWNAVLGGSEHCIATHPSDLAVALVALDAVVQVRGSRGERSAAGRLPSPAGQFAARGNGAAPVEVVTAIVVPANPVARRSHYLKVRDRASFEFAVVSAAVALELQHDGRIGQARVAVGGVGTKPWRLPKVEAALAGSSLAPGALRRAASLAAHGAKGWGHNDFKIELMQRAIVRAVENRGSRGMTTNFIGQPVSRVDGRLKVTGRATYAAEFQIANMAHAAIVRSTIARGRVASIDHLQPSAAPVSWLCSRIKMRPVCPIASTRERSTPPWANACTCCRMIVCVTRVSRLAS